MWNNDHNGTARNAGGEGLKPFRARNIPAYLAVLAAWLAIAAAIAGVAARLFPAKPTFAELWILALFSVMAGMAIMFAASLLNLAKMRAGLSRLAEGNPDPNIPPVWCPVLTAATNAVTACARRLGDAGKNKSGDGVDRAATSRRAPPIAWSGEEGATVGGDGRR